MVAHKTVRIEVGMTNEEQDMLNAVIRWIDGIYDREEDLLMPKEVTDLIGNIYDKIAELMEMIPDEH